MPPLSQLGKWRSGLKAAIDAAPMPKARGREWIPYLSKQPNTQDEINFTGFLDALTRSGDQRLTREHVAELQAENPLTINETPRYADHDYAALKQNQELADLELRAGGGGDLTGEEINRLDYLSSADAAGTRDTYRDARMYDMTSDREFGPLQYMEKTHTSPQASESRPRHFGGVPDDDKQLGAFSSTIRESEEGVTRYPNVRPLFNEMMAENPNGILIPGGKLELAVSPEEGALRLIEFKSGPYGLLVENIHEGSAGYLMEVMDSVHKVDLPQMAKYRENPVTFPKEKKIFRLEQIQGDRHQAAAKTGYAGDLPENEQQATAALKQYADRGNKLVLPDGEVTIRHHEGTYYAEWRNWEPAEINDYYATPSTRVSDRFEGSGMELIDKLVGDYGPEYLDDIIEYGYGKAPWAGRKKGVPQWLRKTFKSALYDAAQEGADVFETVSGDMINRGGNAVYDQMLPRLIREEAKRLGIELPKREENTNLRKAIQEDFLELIEVYLEKTAGPEDWKAQHMIILQEKVPIMSNRDLTQNYRRFMKTFPILWDQGGEIDPFISQMLRDLEKGAIQSVPHRLPLTPEIRKRIIEEGVPVAQLPKKAPSYG